MEGNNYLWGIQGFISVVRSNKGKRFLETIFEKMKLNHIT